MAVRIPSSTGYAEAVAFIGAKLNFVFRVTSGGVAISFTGNDLEAELFDQSRTLKATPTAALSDYTDPESGAVVANAVVTVSDIPTNLPDRQGDYMLVIKSTSQIDPTDIEYVLRARVKFVHPAFDL